MNFGNVMIYLAAAIGVGIVAGGIRGGPSLATWHRRAYQLMTFCLAVASAWLLYLFLSHNFAYSYVAEYSSRDLPLGYLISSFWAGQEGTFLLWAFMASVLGIFTIRHEDGWTRWVMVYFVITQLFLLVLMIVRSPFATTVAVPADGRGLNPLLQDPWMVIHPPIVFLGYAALAIPFVYALAALTTRRFDEFTAQVFPWVAFSVASLGAGIFIGGFWAYKVLGWGGYWGWDPVENSSLIPWLTALALLHGLILFRMQPKLLKTNVGLAIISYLLVVYGTFLTRSGVLADFSVHSFTDLGINAYLIVYMIGVTALSLIALAVRTRDVPTIPISRAVNSREFGLVVGILLLLITAGLVLIGTSAPLLTKIVGQPANVAASYYNMISLPMGILIALTLSVSPFLMFGLTPWRDVFRHVFPSLIVAVVVTIVVLFLGVVQWQHLILIFGATGALTSNLLAIFRYSEGNLLRVPGHVTHFGFALMLLGVLGSSAYSVSRRLALSPGEPQEAFGYDVTFNRLVEGHTANDGYLDLTLTRGSSRIEAKPRLYYSDYTQSETRNPHIVNGIVRDLYLAPLDFKRQKGDGNTVDLIKGVAKTAGDWTLTFNRFSMDSHDEGGALLVTAEITAKRGADTIDLRASMNSGVGGVQPIPVMIPGTGIKLSLVGMQVESQMIRVALDSPDVPVSPRETLALDVSTKPLVSLVWVGVIAITCGSLLSFWRRRRESSLL